MAQVSWFCFNYISTLVENLPLALLEVTTAAHCSCTLLSCTLLTYFVWWSKPFNNVVPTPMHRLKAKKVYALLTCTLGEYRSAFEIAGEKTSTNVRIAEGQEALMSISISNIPNVQLCPINLAACTLKRLLPLPIPIPIPPGCPHAVFLNQSLLGIPGILQSRSMAADRMNATIFIFTILFYGLPHFLAWKDVFPTSYERLC